MPKKKSTPNENVVKEKKKRNTHNSKARGNAYERVIAQELREFFPNIKTSRSESKNMDDAKIDLIDPDGIMPFYPQIKLTQKTPDYFGIEKECPYKDKPFVIF